MLSYSNEPHGDISPQSHLPTCKHQEQFDDIWLLLHKHGETDRQTDRRTETDGQMCRQTDGQADRQKDRDRQTGRHIRMQTDRQIDGWRRTVPTWEKMVEERKK